MCDIKFTYRNWNCP